MRLRRYAELSCVAESILHLFRFVDRRSDSIEIVVDSSR